MRWLPGVALVVAGMVSLAACAPDEVPSQSSSGYGEESGYGEISGDPLGPSTQVLQDTTGKPWSFTDVEEGRIRLVYFGYTSCPDVCPLTMADLAVALERLDADVRARIDVALVSTDPRRDTPEQLDTWLGAIEPDFTGVRGPIKSVIDAALSYGINVEAPTVTDDSYEVTHGAQLIVLKPGGGMVGYFRETVGVDTYVEELPGLLERHG